VRHSQRIKKGSRLPGHVNELLENVHRLVILGAILEKVVKMGQLTMEVRDHCYVHPSCCQLRESGIRISLRIIRNSDPKIRQGPFALPRAALERDPRGSFGAIFELFGPSCDNVGSVREKNTSSSFILHFEIRTSTKRFKSVGIVLFQGVQYATNQLSEQMRHTFCPRGAHLNSGIAGSININQPLLHRQQCDTSTVWLAVISC
jgi:hypothetical protein